MISNSYFVQEDGTRTLVGQGFWYWNPEAKAIKGVSVNEGMPHDLIEMRSRFEGDALINELRAITAAGVAESYAEVWEFTGPDTYTWALHQGTLDGEVWMTDTYHRR